MERLIELMFQCATWCRRERTSLLKLNPYFAARMPWDRVNKQNVVTCNTNFIRFIMSCNNCTAHTTPAILILIIRKKIIIIKIVHYQTHIRAGLNNVCVHVAWMSAYMLPGCVRTCCLDVCVHGCLGVCVHVAWMCAYMLPGCVRAYCLDVCVHVAWMCACILPGCVRTCCLDVCVRVAWVCASAVCDTYSLETLAGR